MVTQKEKHEKALLILENIDIINNRILSFNSDNKIFGSSEHYIKRLNINIAIKNKLKRYYYNNFKID